MGASSRWRLFMSDVSFKGTDAERTLVHRWDRWRGFGRHRRGGRPHNRRLGFAHVLQKGRRRHEEQISGEGAPEAAQTGAVASRPAAEHVLEHLFEGAGRTAVTYEIRAKFCVSGAAEG